MTLLQKTALAGASELLGKIEVGECLPAELEIAGCAGVGRSVVRGLLEKLRLGGHIARSGRNWILVRPFPENASSTIGCGLFSSKKELVKQQMLSSLTGGEFRQGERISELPLARRFGVSTSVIREALLELQPLGAFLKKDRRHWVVTSLGEDQVAHLWEFREMVEMFALRLLFRAPIAPRHAALFKQNRDRTKFLLSSKRARIAEFLEVDLEFHRLLLDSTGNPLMQERAGFVYLMIKLLLVSPRFSIQKAQFGFRQHLEIHDAIDRGMRNLAEKSLLEHLRMSCGIMQSIARRE